MLQRKKIVSVNVRKWEAIETWNVYTHISLVWYMSTNNLKIKGMKVLILIMVISLPCHGKPKKGMNYKKIHKTHKKYKKRNIYGCKNYTFKK